MIRRLFVVLLSLAGFSLCPTAWADIRVVATVSTLAALARELGGEHVSVASLALHTQDPHFVDAKPSLALELNKADLLLMVGLDLEVGWLPPLLVGARNPAIQVGADGHVDCAHFARVLEVPKVVDRSKGDIHPGGNPHYLYDPRQLEHVAIGVSAAMSRVDGAHASQYNERLGRFLTKLHETKDKLAKRMKRFRGQPIITYHRSWTYLTDWLGLRTVAELEPRPGIVPNPSHVAKVLVRARREGVRAIVLESYYPDATAKLVAEKSGARVVVLPGGVDFKGGVSVADHLTTMVSKLEKALAP